MYQNRIVGHGEEMDRAIERRIGTFSKANPFLFSKGFAALGSGIFT